MDLITKTPGLIHIAEEIFSNLDQKSLLECQNVNEHWGSILRNPWFWFRRMEQYAKLSEEHQKDWKDFCEKLCELNLTNDMTTPLNYIYGQLDNSVTLKRTYWDAIMHSSNLCRQSSGPCVSAKIVRIIAPLIGNPNVANEFGQSPIQYAGKNGHTAIFKILAPLTDNPNTPDGDGNTPIHWAARYGYTEIFKMLAPLTENPNAPDKYGGTPIFWATKSGHTEIVKILVPLTSNPNAPNNNGETPIYWAALRGYTEIVEILAPLTENPNAPDRNGYTPIICAAHNGHTEIVKILVPLTSNPNAPNDIGETPIYWAAFHGHREIVRILAHSTDNPNASDNRGITPSSVSRNVQISRFLTSFNYISRKRKAEPTINRPGYVIAPSCFVNRYPKRE